MMKDPSSIREFARTAHRVPSEVELSQFIKIENVEGLAKILGTVKP
jgi:hypothetical protein